MIRAIPIRILREVLLVIVGAEVSFCTEIAQLCRRGHATGRLLVDVVAGAPVDRRAFADAGSRMQRLVRRMDVRHRLPYVAMAR